MVEFKTHSVQKLVVQITTAIMLREFAKLRRV